MGDREFHRAVAVGPREPVHAEVGPQQHLSRREILLGEREHREGGVTEEDQQPAGSQHPRRLGDPAIRIAPDRRPVLRDREIERGVAQWHVLSVGMDEREPQDVDALERGQQPQLGLRDVPHTPADLLALPIASATLDPRVDVGVPARPVREHVVLGHRVTIRGERRGDRPSPG